MDDLHVPGQTLQTLHLDMWVVHIHEHECEEHGISPLLNLAVQPIAP